MAVFFLRAALIAYDFMLSVGYHQSSSGYDAHTGTNTEAGKRLNKYKFKNDAVNGMHSKNKRNLMYQEK